MPHSQAMPKRERCCSPLQYACGYLGTILGMHQSCGFRSSIEAQVVERPEEVLVGALDGMACGRRRADAQ